MNRIQSFWSDVSGPDGEHALEVETGKFKPAIDSGSGHSLFVPLHYEQNYAYPLIVWLHGANDDERQLKRIMPFVSMRNYVGVGPRGTVAADDAQGQVGCSWTQTEEHIALAEQRVVEAVNAVGRQLHVSSQRIFLAGFGCGGTMAFRLALNLPHMFAGALSLGGSFPTGFMPLAQLNQVRKLRFLLASGRDSHRYPPQKVCENLRLLYAAGISISLRQYPCGDDLTTQMLGDMDRWIMEQLAGPPVPSTQHTGGIDGRSAE